MRRILLVVLILFALVSWFWPHSGRQGESQSRAQGDYLVLALSWTPSWCEAEGTARGAARCVAGAGAGWLVHGLWPQHADGGWPDFCASPHPTPDRALLESMVDVMGGSGLAAHQWRKHGTCSGWSPARYFEQTRAAFASLTFPEAIRSDEAPLRMAPEELLTEFRAANPAIGADMVALTCRSGLAQEIRLCLTNSLEPRSCDAQIHARACRAAQVRLPPLP